MKTLITLVVALLISISSFAQQGINYKALIKDSSGNVLSSTYMTVQFTVHANAATGTIVYQEDHNYTTDSNGLIVLNIGTDNSPTVGVFADIDWSTDLHFLQTTITYSGGTIEFDATEFMAVPYAKHAETAANIFSGDYNDLSNQPTINSPSGLEQITQNSNTGFRLIDRDQNRYEPIGYNAVDLSLVDGNGTERFGAKGNFSVAMGRETKAIGLSSIAMGFGTLALGLNSTATGNSTNASGNNSTAMGNRTTASSFAETTLGSYNTSYTPNSTTSWDGDDRLFVVGNGRGPLITGDPDRSDALIVLKNGKVITGGALIIQNSFEATSSWRLETRPNGSLSLYRNGDYRGFFSESTGNYSSISDRRTKKDITAIENGTLNKVMQLNPVSYIMKDQKDTKRNLGLISQEVQDIFPSITTYVEESDLITLSYTELIPILIKALQEQQVIIEAQKAKDVIQDQSIEDLVVRLNLLESKSNN
ncbi:tail fiber domain-containing protein [Winogradskyella forsetii]|uniref:tail fiber domain-containing protein n=1 Tax=Winogradskyella forsetii TaxID=2686077 RepID=UPI0015BD9849|nr:tail fiber domain-containing protein [Winogradskyella forsetii]